MCVCLFITSVYRWRIPSHPWPDRCRGCYCCAAPLTRCWPSAHSRQTQPHYTVRSHWCTHTSFVPHNSYGYGQRDRLGIAEAGKEKKGIRRKGKWSEVIKNRCIYWYVIATWGSLLLICFPVCLLFPPSPLFSSSIFSLPLSLFHAVCLTCGVRSSSIFSAEAICVPPICMDQPAGVSLPSSHCYKRLLVSFWVKVEQFFNFCLCILHCMSLLITCVLFSCKSTVVSDDCGCPAGWRRSPETTCDKICKVTCDFLTDTCQVVLCHRGLLGLKLLLHSIFTDNALRHHSLSQRNILGPLRGYWMCSYIRVQLKQSKIKKKKIL